MSEAFDDWLEGTPGEDEEGDFTIEEYDLTSTPNDFNVKTIVDFIESGVFEIPAFQRNYVWDLRRASKLIESVVMGLPVPQIFLYEKSRNKFLVIDGQQRLMSIYYFVKKRFPRIEKRGHLRRVFDEHGRVPQETLGDDKLFLNFNLDLPAKLLSQANRLNGLNYDTLGGDRTTLELRTIRCVIVKQNAPKEDDSSVYEIFHRLNTGGVNLTAQEIRTSLYHSKFYELLYRLNVRGEWRRMIGAPEPDLRMRDVEILLRGFAMLVEGASYRPSMTRFLNQFSKEMQKAPAQQLMELEKLFDEFLAATKDLPPGAFGSRARKLNVSVFEAVFTVACAAALDHRTPVKTLAEDRIDALKADPEFVAAASTKSTDKARVGRRLERATAVLLGEQQ